MSSGSRFAKFGGGSTPVAAIYEEQYASPRDREASGIPVERYAEAAGYPPGQVVVEETWALANPRPRAVRGCCGPLTDNPRTCVY